MNVRVKALDVSVSDVLLSLYKEHFHPFWRGFGYQNNFYSRFYSFCRFPTKTIHVVANFRDTRTAAQGKLLKALICYWDNKNVRVSNSHWLLNCWPVARTKEGRGPDGFWCYCYLLWVQHWLYCTVVIQVLPISLTVCLCVHVFVLKRRSIFPLVLCLFLSHVFHFYRKSLIRLVEADERS